jgi:hypothetical protein
MPTIFMGGAPGRIIALSALILAQTRVDPCGADRK